MLLATMGVAHAAETAGRVIDLPLSDGDVQRVWYAEPAQPVAALVLFTGFDGVLSIQPDGTIRRAGNFLVRMRESWLAHGFTVAIPDVPSDRSSLMNARLRRSYRAIMRQIVAGVRARTALPIWLVGTSAGSVAAAGAAGELTRGEIAGLVLTSTLSRPDRVASETVFGADLDRVAVPTLIVSNRGDRCASTPPSDGPSIQRALAHAPKTEIILVEGGLPPRSTECEAFAEHGFYGIEAQVVDRISDWIKAQGPK